MQTTAKQLATIEQAAALEPRIAALSAELAALQMQRSALINRLPRTLATLLRTIGVEALTRTAENADTLARIASMSSTIGGRTRKRNFKEAAKPKSTTLPPGHVRLSVPDVGVVVATYEHADAIMAQNPDAFVIQDNPTE